VFKEGKEKSDMRIDQLTKEVLRL